MTQCGGFVSGDNGYCPYKVYGNRCNGAPKLKGQPKGWGLVASKLWNLIPSATVAVTIVAWSILQRNWMKTITVTTAKTPARAVVSSIHHNKTSSSCSSSGDSHPEFHPLPPQVPLQYCMTIY
mmetsp:Transcript_11817/g.21838  ORF Transcript_11817/g.21838 Transcript_11817/m.21838 type:complete len:123 (-) Transcript_11817:2043-2411(-)